MHVLLLGLQVPVRRAGDPCHPPEVPLRLCVDPLLRGRALKEGRKLGFLTSHCFVVFAIRISNLHPLGQSSVVRAVFARAGRHMCKHRRRISSGVPRAGARVQTHGLEPCAHRGDWRPDRPYPDRTCDKRSELVLR